MSHPAPKRRRQQESAPLRPEYIYIRCTEDLMVCRGSKYRGTEDNCVPEVYQDMTGVSIEIRDVDGMMVLRESGKYRSPIGVHDFPQFAWSKGRPEIRENCRIRFIDSNRRVYYGDDTYIQKLLQLYVPQPTGFRIEEEFYPYLPGKLNNTYKMTKKRFDRLEGTMNVVSRIDPTPTNRRETAIDEAITILSKSINMDFIGIRRIHRKVYVLPEFQELICEILNEYMIFPTPKPVLIEKFGRDSILSTAGEDALIEVQSSRDVMAIRPVFGEEFPKDVLRHINTMTGDHYEL